MNRLHKVWSVLLAVVFLGSMAAVMAPAPVSAAVGSMLFAAQSQPTTTNLKVVSGSDISAVAISADGANIYVVNGAAVGAIYKSTDGGMTFNAVTPPDATIAYVHVAVASDSPDSIVVSNGARVFVSTNGGSQWTELPVPVVALTHTVTSVAVGPARSGTLLGREYAVSVANNATLTVAGGDVLILGGATAGWVTAGIAGTSGVVLNVAGTNASRDFMAVRFSPNFVGDRSVVAIGSTAAAGGVAVQVFNTASITGTTGGTLIKSTVLPAVIPSTIDFATAPAATNIIKGSIALPTDYDATTSSGRRAYAGIAAFPGLLPGSTADNDVYRVDDDTATRLSAFPGAGVFSVSYGGTIDTGTLYMGRQSMNEVRYTTNPTSASPTWTATKKILPITPIPATVAAGFEPRNTVVVADAKFATTNKVYAGTSGVESGFSVSTNGGLTFNQTALIDNQTAGAIINTVGINEGGVTTTPDGKSVFIAARVNTGAGATAERWLSLWKSTVPVDSGTWTRVFVVASADLPAANNGRARIKLAPDFATTSAMYFMDLALNGVFYRSTDGGDIYASRLTPAGIAPSSDVEEDANIMYISDGGPTPLQGVNVYKSTTGGWTWESPTAPGVGPIRALVIGKPGELMVGGLGQIAYSKDGGLTFTKYTGFAAGDSYRIAKDANFRTNSTIYLFDATGAPGGTGGVYRYVIGTSAAFEDLGEAVVNPAALPAGVGSGLRGGVLYILRTGLGVTRSLYPTLPAGQQEWHLLNVPLAGAHLASTSLSVTSPANTVYLRNGAQGLWAMYDYVAAAKPKIKSPADNSVVQIDTVNGRANLVTFALEPMGTGTGLVDAFEGQIAEKASGFTAGILSGGILTTQPTSPSIQMGATAPAGFGPPPALLALGWPYVMNSNTEYVVRFRSFRQISGEDATSPWSDPITLKVQSGTAVIAQQAGPVLLGPQGGATGVSLTPGLSWAPMAGATEYEVKLSINPSMTPTVGGTPVKVKTPAFRATAALTPGTTYFWSVQATAPTTGQQSIGTFTTAAAVPKPVVTKPTPPPAPVVPKIIVTVPPAPPAPAPQMITPAYIWAIIVIGAILVIAVIVLIFRTGRKAA